ncbi:NAD-dependent epimerase/dehydratase family protein [Candidatus Woesearchaeota archaeon]|nr:NAD-dependent epimerase/dehydratase family protein [Candidatus Woesearchaeota archaeon]
MKVLVIGGTRFIGYFLVHALLKQRHKVSVLNRGARKGIFGGRVEEIICDRDDKEKFVSEVKKRQFDIAFDNWAFYPEHIKADIEALGGSAKQLKNFIFTSSTAVYDEKQSLPYTENSARNGKNAFGSYGYNKAKCEDILMASHKNDAFPATIIRPSYVYGPRDYSGRMESLLRRLEKGQAIRIPKSNPKSQFSYVHDVVSALTACIGNNKAIGNQYNICGEETVSYGELVELLGEVIGKKPKAKFSLVHDFPYEDWNMRCDVSKSRKELGIKYTPLKEGLKETWEWWRENMAVNG